MNKILVLFICIIVGVSCLDRFDDLGKWMKFQADFGKSYPIEEISSRREFFRQTVQEIEYHNRDFENGKVHYTKEINQFSDWTPAEIDSFLNNTFVRKTSSNGIVFDRSVADIPSSFDWRQHASVTPVKNQGALGASWAFSVTGTIEGQLGSVHSRLASLSEAQLTDCVKDEVVTIEDAYEYVMANGIERESDYPTSQGECKADPSKILGKISGYVDVRENQEDILAEALVTLGPMSVLINVPSDLLTYASGIYDGDMCDSSQLNHAALLVGYGAEDGIDYYIIKNSWGPNWGEAGYFRLIRNKGNRCGIASRASSAIWR